MTNSDEVFDNEIVEESLDEALEWFLHYAIERLACAARYPSGTVATSQTKNNKLPRLLFTDEETFWRQKVGDTRFEHQVRRCIYNARLSSKYDDIRRDIFTPMPLSNN